MNAFRCSGLPQGGMGDSASPHPEVLAYFTVWTGTTLQASSDRRKKTGQLFAAAAFRHDLRGVFTPPSTAHIHS